MEPARIADLSERERECLRLVFAHKQSKDIARLFGLSKRTVDGYLDSARHKLGVAGRIEAAKLLHAHEDAAADAPYRMPDTAYPSSETPYRVTCDPIRVSESPHFVTFAPSPEPARRSDEAFGKMELGEERAAFDHRVFAPVAANAFDWPFRTDRRPYNDLNIWQRSVWSLFILVGLLIGTGLLINSFTTLSQLARALTR